MDYVFDASFVGALIIPDEKNPVIDKIRASIGENEEVFVPQLFWYEIVSIFQKLFRRKRYTYDAVLRLFPILAAIRLTTDYTSGVAYSQKLLQMCNECNLSAYDAAYLELAQRKNALLCTLDEGLRAAAQKIGVAVVR